MLSWGFAIMHPSSTYWALSEQFYILCIFITYSSLPLCFAIQLEAVGWLQYLPQSRDHRSPKMLFGCTWMDPLDLQSVICSIQHELCLLCADGVDLSRISQQLVCVGGIQGTIRPGTQHQCKRSPKRGQCYSASVKLWLMSSQTSPCCITLTRKWNI